MIIISKRAVTPIGIEFFKGKNMSTVKKYENIENELPKLQKVLLDAIQSDFLEIKSVNKTCEKYLKACEAIPALKDAHFVVFSKFIKKSDHRYERFVFLDKEGHEVCDVSGQEMGLHGLLEPCLNLSLSEEYEAAFGNPA